MKKFWLIMLMALAARFANGAEETNAAPAKAEAPAQPEVKPDSFEAFKIITQRNIFDPTRRERSRNSDGPPPEAPKPVETFALLGATSYDGNDFGIFDGSRSEYRKSVKAGESIAGYQLTQVKSGGVTLENSGKTVELPVGWQMKRQGDEEWRASMRTESSDFSASSSSSSERPRSDERGDRARFDRSRGDRERSRSETSSSSRPTESSTTSSSSSSGSGDQNEVLRRLIEQRRRGE